MTTTNSGLAGRGRGGRVGPGDPALAEESSVLSCAVVEGFVEQESGDGVGGEVALFLDRIARTLVGDRFGEHGLDHGVDARGDADAGDGVELGRQVPHAFGIHP
jgi:hypothetical protein